MLNGSRHPTDDLVHVTGALLAVVAADLVDHAVGENVDGVVALFGEHLVGAGAEEYGVVALVTLDHPVVALTVDEDVVAGSTLDGAVVARTAVEPVVAVLADELVGALTAGDGVLTGAAVEDAVAVLAVDDVVCRRWT